MCEKSYIYFIEENSIGPGVIIFITGKEFFENEKCLGFYNEGKFSEDVVNKYLIPSGIGELQECIFESHPDMVLEEVVGILNNIPDVEKSQELEDWLMELRKEG